METKPTINVRVCKDGTLYVEVNAETPETVALLLKQTLDAVKQQTGLTITSKEEAADARAAKTRYQK